jgi:hypothetical protein
MKLCLLIFMVFCAGCILDVTPDPYIPPPLMLRDAGFDEDSGR